MIEVMICDDHQIVRDGLSQILTMYSDVKVVKALSTGESLFKVLKKEQPKVLLLDISLPGRSGLEVLKQVKILYPEIAYLKHSDANSSPSPWPVKSGLRPNDSQNSSFSV